MKAEQIIKEIEKLNTLEYLKFCDLFNNLGRPKSIKKVLGFKGEGQMTWAAIK